MSNRRSFLSGVAGGGAALSLAAASEASNAAAPSRSAAADAAMFRTFDASLSDAELHTIAERIDANRLAARALDPHNKHLGNADEMITRFYADERVNE